jgi:hypothetical protein
MPVKIIVIISKLGVNRIEYSIFKKIASISDPIVIHAYIAVFLLIVKIKGSVVNRIRKNALPEITMKKVYNSEYEIPGPRKEMDPNISATSTVTLRKILYR